MARDKMRLVTDNLCLHEGSVSLPYTVNTDLGEGRSLTFQVVFRPTEGGWEAVPIFDKGYKDGAPGETLDAARYRLAQWFEAAARAMKGEPLQTIPLGWQSEKQWDTGNCNTVTTGPHGISTAGEEIKVNAPPRRQRKDHDDI